MDNPLGIDEERPRLSWLVNDARRGAVQAAYQIQVAGSPGVLGRRPAWDSGRVRSANSIHVEYAGPALESRRRYSWRVRTFDRNSRPSPWSAPAFWEMGLLRPGDWNAEFIGLASPESAAACPLLRRSFRVAKAVLRARAYVTALGVYELRLNGAKVGDDLLSPGWTEYRKRVMYRSHDVTGMIRTGENVVGAILAPGWYSSPLMGSWEGINRPPLKLMAQIEIEHPDGSVTVIGSDGTWKAETGPITLSQLYAGERYDARRERAGWDLPRYRDAGWEPAAAFGRPAIEFNAQPDPPIRVTGEITPVGVTRLSHGRYVFDMGQNMVGVCRLAVAGRKGTVVTLRHAELLNPDGALYVENLRRAEATDTYTLKGGGAETFTPRFTYHGFRYVEVSGFRGTPDLTSLTGLVLHTAPAMTG